MKKPVVNYGESVRARLLSVANVQEVQLEYVLLRYALERFLFRLGKSVYADRFVLKGASAFAVWLGPFSRVTRDADLEAFGEVTPESLVAAFREICSLSYPEDAVEFDCDSFGTSEIKKGDRYPGIRVSFRATIGGARVALQFDIGVGDSVYPSAEQMDYPVLLDGEAPRVRIYPRYTVVAEKFQVMVSRGTLNSRVKDYYDLWLLSESFDFDEALLLTAVRKTFERRQTALPQALPAALSPDYAEDLARKAQWAAFLKRSGMGGENLLLSQVVLRVQEFLMPVWRGSSGSRIWKTSHKDWVEVAP